MRTADPSVVTLKSSVVERVVTHARDAAPGECCGLLIAGLPTRFLIDPQDHLDALRDARGRGLELLGFYHSHPHSAAVPSETDRAEASYPGHLFLIVGLTPEPPEVRLFRLVDGNFHEVAFVRPD